MKTTLLFISFLGCIFIAHCEPKKRALIIAISHYDQDAKWNTLSSAKDVLVMKESLIRYLQFQEANIDVLSDQHATRKGIRDALLNLAAKIKIGDMIVIHYSGHGVQISDEVGGDEMDGLDEALVPYDAPSQHAFDEDGGYKNFKSFRDYDGSLHMRDDEFGFLINTIRKKAGPKGHVVVIIDSCHSGSGARGSGTVRGATEPMILSVGKSINLNAEDKDGGFGLITEDILKDDPSNLGKFILFTGASAEQADYEYDEEKVGSLSYAFSKSLSELKGGETYSNLFNSVQGIMATIIQREQTPTVEGDIDLELFSGNFHKPELYFNVLNKIIEGNVDDNLRPIRNAPDVKKVRINGGTIAGLFPGSEVCFLNATDLKPNPSNPVARGKVVAAGDFISDIEIERPLKMANEKVFHVFVTKYALSDRQVTVSLKRTLDLELQAALKTELSKLGLIALKDDSAKLEVATKPGIDSLFIFNRVYGKMLRKIKINTNTQVVSECKSSIINFAQGQLIKEIRLRDDDIKVELELIPCDSLKPLDKAQFVHGNILQIPIGYKNLMVEVTNKGTEKAYFNIIDIQPDGKISCIIPTKIPKDANDWLLKPGQKKQILLGHIIPPYGNEVFKVIASREKINLQFIVIDPTVSQRGNSDAFETLFKNSYQETFTRGNNSLPERVNTFEAPFVIVPAKSSLKK